MSPSLPRGFTETRTQTLTSTVRAQISLDANRAISVGTLVATTCPAGTTFVRLDGAVLASGKNGAGSVVDSPRIRFTVL